MKGRVVTAEAQLVKYQPVIESHEKRISHLESCSHRWNWKLRNRGEGVIIQFISRVYRDGVWRAAEKSAFLKENSLKLAEDPSVEDATGGAVSGGCDRRSRLWPAVEKARRENKLAFVVGGRAFVNGKEIFP
ncbi:hypothetical protein FQA47_008238 [Oryzias melastigma]|uniref:Uncharacterized protein n=1 Tax=Oryzias melastigma TaxID=30732 RepID=A0A834C8D8_ORYME|nr:hypothetical protein FQA47_008238 [Oryzias melastigma]